MWTAAPTTRAARGGGRVALAAASVPEDEESATQGVDQSWVTGVGNGGLEIAPWTPLTVFFNAEQGFRPPNLDDLSARQPTGRGFQLENADLRPERALTLEVGARLVLPWASLQGWVYQTYIRDVMERVAAECPDGDLECRAARAPIQLVNFEDSELHGLEGDLRLTPGLGITARATVAWAEGETDIPNRAGRQPLSRIPPLNGAVELQYQHRRTGLYAGPVLRWAADQDQLSYGDQADARIPFGGTPGYQVWDLRLGLEKGPLLVAIVMENLTDAPYRIHGSSVNGAGRGLVVNLEVRP